MTHIVVKYFRQHKLNTYEIARILTHRLKRDVPESEVSKFLHNYRCCERGETPGQP